MTLLLGLHLISLASPLGLTPDALSYLASAESIAAGGPARPVGGFSRWPPGYATLLSWSLRADGGSTASLLGWSWAFLCLGTAAFVGLLERRGASREHALLAAGLFLVSLAVCYSMPFVLSDLVFFGLAMSILWILELLPDVAPPGAFYALLAAAAFLIAVMATVRSVGALLCVSLLLAIWRRWSAAAGQGVERSRLILPAAAGIAAVVVADQYVLRTRYLGELIYYHVRHALRGDYPRYWLEAPIGYWGETALNVMKWRLPDAFNPLFSAAGLVLAGYSLVRPLARRHISPTDLFLASYSLVLIVFPAAGHRNWLPIVGFLLSDAIELTLGPPRPGIVSRAVRAAGLVGLPIYALLGGHVLVRRVVVESMRPYQASGTERPAFLSALRRYDPLYAGIASPRSEPP